MTDKPLIQAYVRSMHELSIEPASSERQWMDETPDRYAYRCLPLAIANAHGWEMRLSFGLTATWDGGQGIDAIKIKSDHPNYACAISHFGCGILTFHVPALIRTETGRNLFATGPVNSPKHGISALSGVIETDWSPYGFTMNWKFTAPDIPVRFDKGEAFCFFFPVDSYELASTKAEKLLWKHNPELEAAHRATTESRDGFLKGLSAKEREAVEQGWQKTYFRGKNVDGSQGADKHMTKIRVSPFEEIG